MIKEEPEFYAGEDEARAVGYDADVDLFVPGYQVMQLFARTFLTHSIPEQGNLLIPGCGTGNELVQFAEAHPGWTVTGVDPAEPMLRQAREKVEARGLSNVVFHHGYVHDLPEEQRFDGAISLLTMHFIPDDGRQSDFLRDISSRLAPGAHLVLVNLSVDSPDLVRKYFFPAIKEWQISLAKAHFPEAWENNRQGTLKYIDDCLEEQINTIHHVSEPRLRDMMTLAGFKDVMRFFTLFHYRGWIAVKA